MVKRLSQTGQMAFGGFATPECSDRLFFAVFPEVEAAERIANLAHALRGRHALHGKPLGTDRFHVTLHHLGDYVGLPQDVIAKAGTAAGQVAMPAFEAVFDSASSFGRRSHNRPLVLRGEAGVVALRALQRKLGESLTAAGLGRWVDPRYTPHVTLLYDDRLLPTQAIAPIAWIVREFALVHSLLGKTQHHVLGRWPLQT